MVNVCKNSIPWYSKDPSFGVVHRKTPDFGVVRERPQKCNLRFFNKIWYTSYVMKTWRFIIQERAFFCHGSCLYLHLSWKNMAYIQKNPGKTYPHPAIPLTCSIYSICTSTCTLGVKHHCYIGLSGETMLSKKTPFQPSVPRC